MGDECSQVWTRQGYTLREIAKAAVMSSRLGPEWDGELADGWGGTASPSGLWTQIGKGGERLCPGKGAGRWTITVLDQTTGECGVWDLRELRREMERERAGEPMQTVML